MSKNTENKSSKLKLIQFLRIFFPLLGIIVIFIGLYLFILPGKYIKIVAEDKNAYITNIDTSTMPPTVYISFDYSKDRSIIGKLPAEEYSPKMQECDWVTIFYNVETPRTITMKNPYILSFLFIGSGILFIVFGFLMVVIYYKEAR